MIIKKLLKLYIDGKFFWKNILGKKIVIYLSDLSEERCKFFKILENLAIIVCKIKTRAKTLNNKIIYSTKIKTDNFFKDFCFYLKKLHLLNFLI